MKPDGWLCSFNPTMRVSVFTVWTEEAIAILKEQYKDELICVPFMFMDNITQLSEKIELQEIALNDLCEALNAKNAEQERICYEKAQTN